jgi:hypothetical protein
LVSSILIYLLHQQAKLKPIGGKTASSSIKSHCVQALERIGDAAVSLDDKGSDIAYLKIAMRAITLHHI